MDIANVDEPFLSQRELQKIRVTSKWNNNLKRLLVLLCVLVVSLFISCTVLASQLRHYRSFCVFEDEVYSPVNQLIRKKNVVFDSGFGAERTPYQGSSPEVDAEWDNLYGFGISQIPRESAAKLVNKTVPIPGKPGQYAIGLSVFHQLHCLNMIRKRLYDKTDYPDDHEIMGREHIEHCYDTIRQSLMCSVDVTPLTWKWVEEEHTSKEVASVIHTCRDFEVIREWGQKNKLVDFDRTTYVPDDLNQN